MNLAFKSLRLLVPSMTQGNLQTGGNDWCGRTSGAMIHNYYHALKGTGFQIVNDNARGNLLHVGGPHDGKPAAMLEGSYSPGAAVLAGLQAFGVPGDINRAEIYPLAKRDPTPSLELSPDERVRLDQRGVDLFQDLFLALEAFHPVVIYTMFTAGPTHIVVASGYRIDRHGIWLRIDDPATLRPPAAKKPTGPSVDAGERTAKMSKFEILAGSHGMQLGPDTLVEIVHEGNGQGETGRGAEFWIRVHRLLCANENTPGDDLLCDNFQKNKVNRFLCLLPPLVNGAFPVIPRDRAEAIPGGFRIPLDFTTDGSLAKVTDGVRFADDAAGLIPDRALLAKLWTRTEKDALSGYFPLGANTTWHGGLHLPCRNDTAGEGQPVCAMADGEVVAARWRPRSGGPGADPDGYWGSSNFVLLRHKLDAATIAQARSLHVTQGFGVKAPNVTLPGIPGCPKLQTGDWLDVVNPDQAERCLKPGDKARVALRRLQASVSILQGLTVGDTKAPLTRDEAGADVALKLRAGDRLRLATPVDLEANPSPSGLLRVGLVEIADALLEVTHWRVSAAALFLRAETSDERRLDDASRLDTNRVEDLLRNDIVEVVDRAEEPVVKTVGKTKQEWRRVRVVGSADTDGKPDQVDAFADMKLAWSLRAKPNAVAADAVLKLGKGDRVRFLQRGSAPKFDTVCVVQWASQDAAAYEVRAPSAVRAAPSKAAAEVAALARGARLEVTGLAVRNAEGVWVPVRHAPAEGEAVAGHWLLQDTAKAELKPRAELPWCVELVGKAFFVDAITSACAKIERADREVPVGAEGWVNVRSGLKEHDGVHRRDAYAALLAPEEGPVEPALFLNWDAKIRKLGEAGCPFEPAGVTRDVRYREFLGREADITVDAAQLSPSTGLPKDTEAALLDQVWYSLYAHLDDRHPLEPGRAASDALPWLPQFPQSGKVAAARPALFVRDAGAERIGALKPGDELRFTGARNGHRFEAEVVAVVPETSPTHLRCKVPTVLWVDDDRTVPLATLLPGDTLEFDRKPGVGWAAVAVVQAVPGEVDLRYTVQRDWKWKTLYRKPGEGDVHALRQGDVLAVVAAPELYKGRWNAVRVEVCASKPGLVGKVFWISRTGLEKALRASDADPTTPGLARGPRVLSAGTEGFVGWSTSAFEAYIGDRAPGLVGKRGWVEYDRARFDVKLQPDGPTLEALRAGKVVHLGVPMTGGRHAYAQVRAGETIGYVGVYGDSDTDVPSQKRLAQVHWEVFSERCLFARHALRRLAAVAEDTSEDYNVDHARLLGIIRGGLEAREAGLGARVFEDNLLDADEVKAFYAGGGKVVEALRRCACRFVSEWGVDLAKAAGALKGVRGRSLPMWGKWQVDRIVKNTGYLQWWKEAVAAGVPLPGSPQVWHYSPAGFLEFFGEAEIERKSAPPGTSFDFVRGFEPLDIPQADAVPDESLAEDDPPEEIAGDDGPPPEQH